MISAIVSLGLLALALGLMLGYAAIKFKVNDDPLVGRIDTLLPQTQCGQCGYPGCKPYAEAIAKGDAKINQCVPGGETTVKELAELMGVEVLPMEAEPKLPAIAVIDERICIGCTLCIQACPVDAILGAAKHMHTVLSKECTGCELCLEPCPVDCIRMVPIPETAESWRWNSPLNTHPHPVIPLVKAS